MQNKQDLNPAEKALESALGQLKPAASRLSRDELMFKAGRAMTGNKGPWQMLCGVLTVLLVGSALVRPGSNEMPELADPIEPARFETLQIVNPPAQVDSGGSLEEYVTLRQRVVEQGLDSLPPRRTAGSSEPRRSRRQLLESMLSS
jgi:hypothetical protein